MLEGYENFDAFSDMEYMDSCGTYLEAYKLFPHLAAQYPDAVFILNTRDKEAWVKSLLNWSEPYTEAHMRHFNVTSQAALTDCWLADWERHHRRVMEFFLGSSYRFFVWRIESDPPGLFTEQLPELSLNEKSLRA